MSFNCFPRGLINPPKSCHIGGGGWRGVGSETRGISVRQTWRLKNEWSQMSSCELIRFSITVSSNHSERRETMKRVVEGVMNRWGNLGRKGWSRSMMWLCVRVRVKCNEPGNEPQGVSPFWSYFTSNPVDVLHRGKAHKNTRHVCVHVFLVFLAVGVSNLFKTWIGWFFSFLTIF